MKTISAVAMPHETMMRAIQRRAPTRYRNRFEGTSKMT
jgi:hypothetical protein